MRAGMTRPVTTVLLAAVLLGLTLGCSQPGPSVDEPPVQKSMKLTPVVDGLSPAHRAEVPLLEMVAYTPPSTRPGEPTAHTSRVYRDGSYYLLQSAEGAGAGRWAYLSSVKPEGITRLEELFGAVCEGSDPLYGNDEGGSVYRVTTPGCTREFVVTGVPSGDLARLADVTDIISHNMNTIPRGP